jgi:hypothetical protein
MIPSLIKRNWKGVKVALSLSVFLIIFQIYEKVVMQKQQYFVVYDVPNESAIDFVDGSENYFLATEKLNNDQSKMRFHIMHYRWEMRVQKSTLIPNVFSKQNYFRKGNYIQFFNTKILLWDTDFKVPNNVSNMKFDFVIVSGKAKVNLESINYKQLVIDSSVPKYKWEQIKKECLKRDIPFYNVSTDGAFIELI